MRSRYYCTINPDGCGAVMVLAFEARLSTRDVDVFIRSPREARIVRELAKRVARERDRNDDWLNDAAKGYLVGVSEGQILDSAPVNFPHGGTMWMLQMRVACYKNWQSPTMPVMFGGVELNPIWCLGMN